MKILSIMAGDYNNPSRIVRNSNLSQSSPYGYDVVVANPYQPAGMYGTQYSHTQGELDSRWIDALMRWSDGKKKIIVMMNSITKSDIDWLPIESSLEFESAGKSDYLGLVTSTDPITRRFLSDNKQDFSISTYLRYQADDPNIIVNSRVDEVLLTSFTYKKDNVEILFIPSIEISKLDSLFTAFDAPANAWNVPRAKELSENISKLDASINELYEKRDELYKEQNELNSEISNTIQSDVYLTRAISHYDATRSSESPTAEGYYGAIEAIENAFNSEREMQSTLGLSKNYVSKVMRRANEFRHEAKDGRAPTPLTDEEIKDFSERVDVIISLYINYLLK